MGRVALAWHLLVRGMGPPDAHRTGWRRTGPGCKRPCIHGQNVLAFTTDVRSRLAVKRSVQRAIEHHGRINVLINTAGITAVGPLEHMRLEDFEDSMRVHFWGPLYAMSAVIPPMQLRGEGRIVNIVSIGGRIPIPHLAPYIASKCAYSGLSEAFSIEIAKDGSLVTSVYPGRIRTGSATNTTFKGRHLEEYACYALFEALPCANTDARRAARQILRACQRGQPNLTITTQARAAEVLHATVPNLFMRSMRWVNRLLPAPTGPGGDEPKRGWQQRTHVADSPLLRLGDPTAERNNELHS